MRTNGRTVASDSLIQAAGSTDERDVTLVR
jgi:hypothetical protein